MEQESRAALYLVSSAMVRSRIVTPAIEASTAVQAVHLRLGARSASEIRITTDRAEVRGASGEIMVREGLCCGVVAVPVPGGGAGMSVDGVKVVVVRRRLPVDRLEALIELLGAAEFPLAEDGPEDEDTTDGGHCGKENGEDIALLFSSGTSHCRGCGGLCIHSLGLG